MEKTAIRRPAKPAAANTEQLRDRIIEAFVTLKDNPQLLNSFIKEIGLPVVA
jgi:hypothetical protein